LSWLLDPRGWCFSLNNGQYGIFQRAAPLDVADSDATITAADIGLEPDALPPWETVDFRPLEPIDLIEIRSGGNQLDGNSGETTTRIKARDPRAVQRKSNATVAIDARTLPANGSWHVELGTLWSEDMARWYAEPHAKATMTVKGNVARDIGPGSIIRYTSAWPATREGQYGMTARLGRVMSVELDTATLAKTCEVLMAPGDPLTKRRFGPIAALVNTHTTVETRHNSATQTLYCQADAFGRGDGVSDVAAFDEPSWSTTGGQLICNVWASYDGVTWEQVAVFYVESVNTTLHTITYTVAEDIDGAIPENRYCIVLPVTYDEQDASEWPRALFGVTCGVDGLFGGSNIAGFPWVES
jgi:hypothetical protein